MPEWVLEVGQPLPVYRRPLGSAQLQGGVVQPLGAHQLTVHQAHWGLNTRRAQIAQHDRGLFRPWALGMDHQGMVVQHPAPAGTGRLLEYVVGFLPVVPG